MSDNDLIRCGDAEEARDELVRVLNYINTSGTLDYADYCELFDTIERVFDALKTVPREMTVMEFARVRNRMCLFHFPFCNGCTVLPERKECGEVIHDCPLWTLRDPDKAVAIVKEWAKEHPKEANDVG